MQEVPRGWGWLSLAAVILVAAGLPGLLSAARREPLPPQPAVDRVLLGACILFGTAQLAFALVRTVKPKVLDIGATTLDAVVAVLHGQNPYALPLDQIAGG